MVTDGKSLYGAAPARGPLGNGLLFKIDTTGRWIKTFDMAAFNAYRPVGLVLKDDRLYGMTNAGGVDQQGSIFSIDTSFVSFAALRSSMAELAGIQKIRF
jgi:hypothetical protein